MLFSPLSYQFDLWCHTSLSSQYPMFDDSPGGLTLPSHNRVILSGSRHAVQCLWWVNIHVITWTDRLQCTSPGAAPTCRPAAPPGWPVRRPSAACCQGILKAYHVCLALGSRDNLSEHLRLYKATVWYQQQATSHRHNPQGNCQPCFITLSHSQLSPHVCCTPLFLHCS